MLTLCTRSTAPGVYHTELPPLVPVLLSSRFTLLLPQAEKGHSERTWHQTRSLFAALENIQNYMQEEQQIHHHHQRSPESTGDTGQTEYCASTDGVQLE